MRIDSARRNNIFSYTFLIERNTVLLIVPLCRFTISLQLESLVSLVCLNVSMFHRTGKVESRGSITTPVIEAGVCWPFLSSVLTKKQAWLRLSEELCIKGHVYTGEDRDKKVRSLKLR